MATNRRSRTHVVRTALVVGALVVAGCGDDGEDTSADTTAPPATDGPPATDAAPEATPTTTPTSVPATEPGELPGVPFELGPQPGAELGVIGVAQDDVLDVRAGPGADAEVVGTLDPTADGVVATGEARLLDDGGIWYGVELEGVEPTDGWVASSFVAHLGQVDDATAEVLAALGGSASAATMPALAELVAATQSSEEPPSVVVQVVAPTFGDLGEVTYDVVGLGDDATRGLRLLVVGQPDPSGEGFTLRTVERTVLCGRGVTDDGLCV